MDLGDYVFKRTHEFEVYDSYDYKRYLKNEAIISAAAYFGGHILGFNLIESAGFVMGIDTVFRFVRGGSRTPVSGLVGKIKESFD